MPSEKLMVKVTVVLRGNTHIFSAIDAEHILFSVASRLNLDESQTYEGYAANIFLEKNLITLTDALGLNTYAYLVNEAESIINDFHQEVASLKNRSPEKHLNPYLKLIVTRTA